ncbi:MAG: cytochrome c oxidase subunit II [Alphaproteobacteria bacterium]|nr:cytochrome c oxidase subunit II [Alphaproteobacteria bacterium]
MRRLFAMVAALPMLLMNGSVFASGPRNWQLGLPEPASPTAVMIDNFHDGLLIIITLISVFVLALLLYACWRFRESRNPTPSTTTHNTVIEILWTVVPILILIGIAIPSFRLLYFADRDPNPEMTLKIIGSQWYWTYEYPDHGNFTFDANLVPDDELKPGQKRLMDTDNPVVLPVGKRIRLLMTASDVIHAWAISSVGVRLDTVPGQTNETWVQFDRPGTYYGFCSELCGAGHAYMPIMVKAVPPAEFEAWTEKAKKEFARVDEPSKPAVSAEDAPAIDVAKSGATN